MRIARRQAASQIRGGQPPLFRDQQKPDVRYGSEADVRADMRDVRFIPKNRLGSEASKGVPYQKRLKANLRAKPRL